jgi:membrane protease YdiL (CAAX protease family)
MSNKFAMNEWLEEIRENEKNTGEWITFLAYFGSMVILGIFLFGQNFSDENLTGGQLGIMNFLLIIGLHLWLLIWSLFFTRIFKNEWKNIGLKSEHWWLELGLGLAIGIGLALIMAFLSDFLLKLFPSGFYEEESQLIPEGLGYTFLALCMAFSAGIAEEITYRGYANLVVTKYTGIFYLGPIVLSLAFGATHLYQGIPGFIVTIIFALVLHVVFLWRGSIISLITAHVIYDIIVIFL